MGLSRMALAWLVWCAFEAGCAPDAALGAGRSEPGSEEKELDPGEINSQTFVADQCELAHTAAYIPAHTLYVESNVVGSVMHPSGDTSEGGSIFYQVAAERAGRYFGRATWKAPQGEGNNGLDPVRFATDYTGENVIIWGALRYLEKWDGRPQHVGRWDFKPCSNASCRKRLHKIVVDNKLMYPKPDFKDDPSFKGLPVQ